MRNRFSLALVLLLFIALSLPAFVFAQQTQERTTTTTANPSGRSSGASDPATRRSSALARSRATNAGAIAPIEQDFSEALSVIRENYVDGNKLNYNDVFKSSIIGMLRSLDPHSNYYDRDEFEEEKTRQRSQYFGIGALIGNQTIKDQTDTYIMSTLNDDSPASRAGLRFGDRIIEVNGESMHEKSTAEVRDKIRGPRGTTVKIKIEHGATKQIDTVEITRDAVPQPSIPDAYMLRPGVGYIDMRQGFNYTTADELQAALDYLNQRGMTSLVLDLRDNPGGFLDQAIRVSEKFLRRGQPILTQKGRDGLGDRTYKSSSEVPNMTPLVILVNENTASASEIVAGAMQDHDRALIVGETSFGKGLVQSIFPLEYGGGLTLTTAKYYTPSGRLIQRDYSNGGFYDYYTRGGLGSITKLEKDQPKPTGPESRTDTGRPVYGGGGITPDEIVKPRTFNVSQQRLLSPIFFFTRELVGGRIQGFESYKLTNPADYDHQLQPDDFQITDALFNAFKSFALKEPSWKVTAPVIDRNRDFVALQLRYTLATAAYGQVMANRVYIMNDPQVAKAIDAMPRARELAMTAMAATNGHNSGGNQP